MAFSVPLIIGSNFREALDSQLDNLFSFYADHYNHLYLNLFIVAAKSARTFNSLSGMFSTANL